MTKPPKHVLRFYGNTDYALGCIGFKEITFLHQEKLNDPFDPNLVFSTDFNESYEELIAFVEKNHPKDIQKFRENLPEQNWNNLIKKIRLKLNNFRNGTFLFSTIAVEEGNHPKDNLYMWGHYGNGHRGIAIEFETDLLEKSVREENRRLGNRETDIDDIWSEVHYPDTDNSPVITGESIYLLATQHQNAIVFGSKKSERGFALNFYPLS